MSATAPAWRWIPESQQLALDTPRRQLTIRWDDADSGWFLSVIYPPRPSTMGQPPVDARVYICPLPLLCALVLVPPSLHEHLTGRVKRELDEARGGVYTHLSKAAGHIPTAYPGAFAAQEELEAAAAASAAMARLSLDWAAHEALED